VIEGVRRTSRGRDEGVRRGKKRKGAELDPVGAGACCSCYQRVISIEVRPFSRTIDTRRQGVPASQGVGETKGGREARRRALFSLAWLMRGRFCTQRGSLLGRGTMMARTHPRSPGSPSRSPAMVMASRSLPPYNHLQHRIRCFVTLAPIAPDIVTVVPMFLAII